MNTLESLVTACKTHDWYYNYSDDNRVWSQGQDELNKIKGLLKQAKAENLTKDAIEIYDTYSPWQGTLNHMLIPDAQIADEDKINPEEYSNLLVLSSSFRKENPGIRLGQAFMILLNERHKELYTSVTSTNSDVFQCDTTNRIEFINLFKSIVKK